MRSVAALKPKLLLWLGTLLIIISGVIGLNLFGPVLREEVRYQWRETVFEDQALHNYPCPEGEFLISIFKMGICARVVPNVDPFNSRVYQLALTQGVAHAAGTGLPGEGKNIFLFAHSSGNPLDAARYNSIFYLLYKLTPGDTLTLTRAGQVYSYQVESLAKVNADQVSYLDPLSDGETLTLMTCWPPGTTLKRLIVVAKPVSL